MRIRLTQIDGDLPTIALMRLAAWHRSIGDEVHWRHGRPAGPARTAPTSSASRSKGRRKAKRADGRMDYSPEFGEPAGFDRVYASAIFDTSAERVADFRRQWPDAEIGGTCAAADGALRVESIVPSFFQELDYSGYPGFEPSIGYTMRGCRLACTFCMVRKAEGRARSNSVVNSIWRGPGHPRRIHDLSNDFFGNPDWRSVVEDVVEGGFEICINQGINVRLLSGRLREGPGVMARVRRGEATDADRAAVRAAEELADEQCAALFRMMPKNARFTRPTLYTAWDNLGDEDVFFEGVDRLMRHGFRPEWITTYMLVGYDPRETWDDVMHRYGRMDALGIRVYPMVYGGSADRPAPKDWKRLKAFQSWVITGARRSCAFADFNASHRPERGDDRQMTLV